MAVTYYKLQHGAFQSTRLREARRFLPRFGQ